VCSIGDRGDYGVIGVTTGILKELQENIPKCFIVSVAVYFINKKVSESCGCYKCLYYDYNKTIYLT
jgi:hypothetical protein